MDVDFRNFRTRHRNTINSLHRPVLVWLTDPTQPQILQNLSTSMSNLSTAEPEEVPPIPSPSSPPPPAPTFIVNEAGTSACSTDQIVAAGTEKRDHLHQPDQGEPADEQRPRQGVQELRLHTTPPTEHHSSSWEKERSYQRHRNATATPGPAEIELHADAARGAHGRRSSSDGRWEVEEQST